MMFHKYSHSYWGYCTSSEQWYEAFGRRSNTMRRNSKSIICVFKRRKLNAYTCTCIALNRWLRWCVEKRLVMMMLMVAGVGGFYLVFIRVDLFMLSPCQQLEKLTHSMLLAEQQNNAHTHNILLIRVHIHNVFI